MLPKERDRDLVLVATGVAVGPFLALSSMLLEGGFDRRIEPVLGPPPGRGPVLHRPARPSGSAHPNLGYHVSLSQPPGGWAGLRGRVTESVPPLIDELATGRPAPP